MDSLKESIVEGAKVVGAVLSDTVKNVEEQLQPTIDSIVETVMGVTGAGGEQKAGEEKEEKTEGKGLSDKDDVKEQMSGNKRKLEERGEKLEEMNKKSSKMEESAEEFKDKAEQLKNKMKAKAGM